MIRVSPLHMLGNPNRVDVAVSVDLPGCPCDGTLSVVVYEDGSVICANTGFVFAPEPADMKLWQMRRDFDRRLGISPSDRLTLPALVANGMTLHRS